MLQFCPEKKGNFFYFSLVLYLLLKCYYNNFCRILNLTRFVDGWTWVSIIDTGLKTNDTGLNKRDMGLSTTDIGSHATCIGLNTTDMGLTELT